MLRIILSISCLTMLTCQQQKEFDIIISGGEIIDGTGSSAYRDDIGILNDQIAAIGPLDSSAAKSIIDASGKVVSPGFIDMMGGSSLPLLTDPESARSKLHQGITTMMVGEGGSLAPQNEETFLNVRFDVSTLRTKKTGLNDFPELKWQRYSDYFNILEKSGIGLNVIHNVGAAQVRRVVLGNTDVTPSNEQLQQMRQLVEDAMKDGAIGLSTSLIYPPGTYATTDEIIELAKVAAAHNGVYFTHMRNESSKLLSAIDEALLVGTNADLPVHIYHLKAAGQRNWPLMEKAITKLEQAAATGSQVTADVYPYIRNGIGLGSFLHPRHYAEGAETFVASLADPNLRDTLKREVIETSDWENWYQHVGQNWDNVLITRVGDNSDTQLVGLSIAEAAKEMGVSEWDAFFNLVQEGGCGVAPKSMNEEQKYLAMEANFIAFDNDSRPINPAAVDSAHPRAFGSFPRILSKYVREHNIISLPEAIRKLTTLPADILRLSDRGRIATGMKADLLVFDPEKVKDTATFVNPLAYSVGMDFVLINGTLVIADGSPTYELPGSVIRHTQ